MNDDYIVPVYIMIDDVLRLMNYQDDVRTTVGAAEVLTVAVVAARFFQTHHERALHPAKAGRYFAPECVALQPSPARPEEVLWLLMEVLIEKSSPQAQSTSLIPCSCRYVSGCEINAARESRASFLGGRSGDKHHRQAVCRSG